MLTTANLKLSHKRVLIREDFNVPLQQNLITSAFRLQATLPTLRQMLAANAAIILVSHLGRPQADSNSLEQPQFSLRIVADYLSKTLGKQIQIVENWHLPESHPEYTQVNPRPGEILMLENIRFLLGEEKNDSMLANKLASLCDIFVMDAFGVAHRTQASTYGVIKVAPQVCAGPLLATELSTLDAIMNRPRRPMLAVIGGAKVSSKIILLHRLLALVDYLIIGGALANTFIKAAGYGIGKSMYEPEMVAMAKAMLENPKIIQPIDLVVAPSIEHHEQSRVTSLNTVQEHEMILDIGPQTRELQHKYITKATTIVWNGPMGAFEYQGFSAGTIAMARNIADSSAFSVIGGGETQTVVEQLNIQDKISYVSTGGGAFIQYIGGQDLPAVTALLDREAHDNGS